MIDAGLVESAHDCSEGGLAVALAECGFAKGIGARSIWRRKGLPPEFVLFGEDASRIVISCDPQNVSANQTSSGKIRPLSRTDRRDGSRQVWKSEWTASWSVSAAVVGIEARCGTDALEAGAAHGDAKSS